MKNLLTILCLALGLMLVSSLPTRAAQEEQPTKFESEAQLKTELTQEGDHDVAHAGDDEALSPDGAGHGHHLGEPHEEPTVLPSTWRTDMSLYSLAVFLTLLVLLGKFVWGPIMKGLDDREASIKNDIAAAEKARLDSEKMLADYQKKLDAVQDEVREIIAEARRDAEHTKNDIIATAQREAQATQKRAVDEIEQAKDHALSELFSSMSNQVVSATELLLKRAIDSNDRQRLVQDALNDMNSSTFQNN